MTIDKMMELKKALLAAKQAAEKLKDTEDGGTCNFDTPILVLPKEWSVSNIYEAFEHTGLRADITRRNFIRIYGAVEGQGFRRTYMAEAFRDSLKAAGYDAIVEYRMD